MFNQWSDEENEGWSSLTDSVSETKSFKELQNLVYGFACETGTTFRFTEVEEGEEIFIMR